MVGSYPPKETTHSFTTPEEDIPHGALARGTYTVHSLFTDDDKNEHLKVIFIDNTFKLRLNSGPQSSLRIILLLIFIFQWEWQFELKKDWA